MSTLDNMQDGQPLHTDEVKTNDTPDSQKDISIEQMIINVFFDGTGNNMFNSELTLKPEEKLSDEEKYLKKRYKNETSYGNYYSNIALLYMASTTEDDVQNIYIQGSGTFQYKGDTDYGLGLSMGESGVYARVAEAFDKMQKILTPYQDSIKSITLNVFGFSRGAFYACYFTAMVKVGDSYVYDPHNLESKMSVLKELEERKKCGRDQLMLDPYAISLNLVGIYDTVSSHGIDHYNDVKPFRLNIGRQQEIKKIIHLTAQNDYRKHFPLTHINTAADEGIGFECSLPGAHSDIGGAYCNDCKENNYLSLDRPRLSLLTAAGEIDWNWFIKMGYYQYNPQAPAPENNQIIIKEEIIPGRNPIYYRKVYAAREFTSNSYQFIQLLIMKQCAEKYASLQFNDAQGVLILDKDIASIDQHGVLKKFKDYACDYVQKNSHKSGLYFAVNAKQALSDNEQLELYNKFIHNSLDPTTLANCSDSRNRGPKRIEINDNS